MNNNVFDINIPKLLGFVETIQIGETASIDIGLYIKRGKKFYEVNLNLKDKTIFLGRYDKDYDKLEARYNDGKILIFTEKYDVNEHAMKINNVFDLFDIADETHYSCTELEALNVFDSSLDISGLKNKNRNIIRSDVEKKHRLK